MIARIITCTVDPSRVAEFRLLNLRLRPKLQAQPGILENIEALDASSGQFSSTTLWQSRWDVENYDQGAYLEMAEEMSPLLMDEPLVQTVPVENVPA